MINIIDINDILNKNMNVIIDILINHYGQEYSDVIRKRLDNVFFDFSSTPEEEYNFLKMHGNQLSGLSKLLIKLRYGEFKRIQSDLFEANYKWLIEYAQNKLLMGNIDKVNVESEKFLSLFTDKNFNGGYIDAFSSASISLLNDLDIAESIKESIINDQKEFMSIADSLGIRLENLSTEDVDDLIEYRKKRQTSYKKDIIQNSLFGKNLFKSLKKRFSFELSPEDLSEIAFLENAWAGYIVDEKEDHTVYHQIIKIPLLHLMNLGIKGLDVGVIHEIIHKIETNGDYVGISIHDENDTNNIINEIRTQNLAIKITKELHKLGIYIYDTPNDSIIERYSNYEALFPLTKEFIDEHEVLISNCAINNTPHKLDEYFGESWKEFSEQINNLYYKNRHYFSANQKIPNIYANDNITKLINSMEEFKKEGIKNA